jgi:hypothetical protein
MTMDFMDFGMNQATGFPRRSDSGEVVFIWRSLRA